MNQMSRQQASPFQILKSGHSRIRDVRRANIITIGKVSDSIKTTFGPGVHAIPCRRRCLCEGIQSGDSS